ncbi:velvet factor, partial [Dioszegia hungarica]
DSLSTDRKYEMSMRQQPLQARMCSAGEKADRRPIDPPPIVQLKVTDTNGEDVTDTVDPYYFLYATLVGSDEAQTELHVIEDGKTRLLTGTPVSSLYYLKDVNHRDAAFFVFPDLGVRKEGQYKLKLTLFEIVDQEVFYCATSFTDTFTVLSAKKFPGMQRATDLSKTFADQGLKIRVRKETK